MSFFSKDSKKGKDYIEQKYGVDVPNISNSTIEYLYSVYDVVCEEYNPPFVCKNIQTAIRNMRDSLKDAKQSIIAMHPEDYILFEIATYDKTTGVILPQSEEHRKSYHLSKLFTSVTEEINKDEIQNK